LPVTRLPKDPGALADIRMRGGIGPEWVSAATEGNLDEKRSHRCVLSANQGSEAIVPLDGRRLLRRPDGYRLLHAPRSRDS